MTDFYQHIQDYLDNLLSDSERQIFENALAKDPELNAEVKRQKMIFGILQHHIDTAPQAEQLAETLQQKRKQFISAQPNAINSKLVTLKTWGIGLAVAASITLVILLSGIFNTTNFTKLPTMPNYSMRGERSTQHYTKARQAFNAQNYAEATAILQTLQKNKPETALYTYYLGLSYLGQKHYKQAVSPLKTIADGPSLYHEDASYFLGVTYYKLNRDKEAKHYLEMVSSESSYAEKAQDILKKTN